ncbi:MAG: hypothetical protein KatS3mg105_1743 [Gemmatales bacterium]|nr:MAG: hypothetical protein KatS3mg105_1743 [Gemmatales bacterium]
MGVDGLLVVALAREGGTCPLRRNVTWLRLKNVLLKSSART